MFDWEWKRWWSPSWQTAIDIAVLFVLIGLGFLVWALLSTLVFRHLIDAVANGFIEVIASYAIRANGYVFSVSLFVIIVSLAFIAIPFFIWRYNMRN